VNTASPAQTWVKVAVIEEVPMDGTLQRMVRQHAVCLYNIGGTIYATDDACTHGEASLADGFIVDSTEIECPYHQGRFDVRTGKATKAPCMVDLRTYPIRIVNDVILIQADEIDSGR
jgi:naphthalene 1,2-dioxygenase system ferredoxin subunit